MPPRRFQALLFDLDGTLVDTRLDFAALRRELGFPDGIGLLEHLETLPAADVHRARAVIDRHEMAGASAATWIDGAQALLADLHRRGVPTAILTRNSRAAVARTDQVLGLPVDLILTREDCPPKPDPGGLLRIADTLRLTPARCLYVGDFVYDLRAARNAGMAAGLLLNGKNGHFADQADRVVGHLGELLDWLE
ncbi:HAD family hydrolase [Alloalcanivorax profundimaris]|uniref:HAD family hydrolase n=1 Tax=Alloalcanivorax profundimaris TaxID=2735259 RepID=UPI001888F25A|nr:HAD family hydrolase [Alloalcanivorax profundimaris]MBF1803226.1 HAD family hydrolase [Alloalcanivorax profundimaris]